MKDWAQRIHDEARERGWGPTDVAKAAGVKQPSVNGWYGYGGKQAAKTLSAHALVKFCESTGLDPAWIMTGRGSKLSQSVRFEQDILESAIVSAKEALRSLGKGLDERLSAGLIAWAYSERLKFPRIMDSAEYIAFDNAVASKLKGAVDEESRDRRRAEKSRQSDVPGRAKLVSAGHRGRPRAR